MDFNRDILNLQSPVIFFPVRHHSPVGARLLRQLMLTIQPAAVLIEGPSDFNDQIDQLTLPHQLPIAIYSYAHLSDGTRRGAFYPYCEYSPEWQALQSAKALNIPARFIDLPWTHIASTALSTHRYAETALHQSQYVRSLSEKLGLEGLDNLWDNLFEIEATLTLQTYLERCHQFCFHCRSLDRCLSAIDPEREAFMVEQIQQSMKKTNGQIVVVTGGYHSYALYAKVFNRPFDEPAAPASQPTVVPERTIQQQITEQITEEITEEITEKIAPQTEKSPDTASTITYQGSSLTPFTDERLDSLKGYDAGMPSPGFYYQVWKSRTSPLPTGNNATPSKPPYRQLFTQVVGILRQQNQVVSAADLIAVESMARSLADLRGHSEIWRQDILEAITAALIKEAIHPDRPHPFLLAAQRVFQGQRRGQLAKKTTRPPLVRHIQAILSEFNLTPQTQARSLLLNLYHPQQRQKSQVLHQLRTLQIAGYDLLKPCNWIANTEVMNLQEEWLIHWSPEFEASCIESVIYGCTLADAAAARLQEAAHQQSQGKGPSAAAATHLLLESFLIGLPHLTLQFCEQLIRLIQTDNNFFSLSGALDPLLFLYHYDDVLGTAGHPELGEILAIAVQRALWLLNSIGKGNSQQLLSGIKAILTTFERCQQSLQIPRETLVQTFTAITADRQQSTLLRGAAVGSLWRLAATSADRLTTTLPGYATTQDLGDFLTGLFYLAREVVQREPDLLRQVDQIIATFNEKDFLEALPALHLAFTYFTPREKHEISHTLLSAWNDTTETQGEEAGWPVQITAEVIARAQTMEQKALETLERYGLRGYQGGES